VLASENFTLERKAETADEVILRIGLVWFGLVWINLQGKDTTEKGECKGKISISEKIRRNSRKS